MGMLGFKKRLSFIKRKKKLEEEKMMRDFVSATPTNSSLRSSNPTTTTTTTTTTTMPADLDVPLNDSAQKQDLARDNRAAIMAQYSQSLQSTYSLASFAPGMLRGISEKLDNFYLYDFDQEDDAADGGGDDEEGYDANNYDVNQEINEAKSNSENDDDDDLSSYYVPANTPVPSNKAAAKDVGYLLEEDEMTVTPECFVVKPRLRPSSVSSDSDGNTNVHSDGSSGMEASKTKNPPTSSVTDVPVGDPSFSTPEVTRTLVRKFISDIWNKRDFTVIPQVCSPKIRYNNGDGCLDKVGHEGFAQMVHHIHDALTEYHCEIHSMVVEGNKAFCRMRMSGKHTGSFLGYPPTGKVVSWMGATEFTCVNGTILKVWELLDLKMLDEQLKLQCYEENCLQQL